MSFLFEFLLRVNRVGKLRFSGAVLKLGKPELRAPASGTLACYWGWEWVTA